MRNGSFVLDTNIVIALFASDEAVLEQLAAADEIFIPSIVLGELFYGARRSARAAENVARIEEFASGNAILNCTAATARHYGVIKNALRSKGRPIPENDIWIAAIAAQYDLSLVTRDDHFTAIDDLKVAIW